MSPVSAISEFFNEATLIGTATTAPYRFDWTNVPSGAYTLTAKATDDRGGNTMSSPVTVTVNAAPAVTLTAPAIGARFIAPLTALDPTTGTYRAAKDGKPTALQPAKTE